jgi:Aldehyde dehydrogenase family
MNWRRTGAPWRGAAKPTDTSVTLGRNERGQIIAKTGQPVMRDGLNAAVFTNEVDRAYHIAREIRSGTVGHNGVSGDFTIAFGGFKQSGLGREGGLEGLLPFLETKTVLLDGAPTRRTA